MGAIRCIKAGQNPMTLTHSDGRNFFFMATQGNEIKPEYFSFIALHGIINFNDVRIPESSLVSTMTPLAILVAYFSKQKIKQLHLLLETGLDVNHGCSSDHKG